MVSLVCLSIIILLSNGLCPIDTSKLIIIQLGLVLLQRDCGIIGMFVHHLLSNGLCPIVTGKSSIDNYDSYLSEVIKLVKFSVSFVFSVHKPPLNMNLN